MEKQFHVPAELFKQTQDLLSLLMLPHILDHIRATDANLARDVIEISLSYDAIATRRHINDLMRKAFTKGDSGKVLELKNIKKSLECDAPREIK